MKRFLAIFLCLVMIISLSAIFTSCDNDDKPAETTTASSVTTTEEEEDEGGSSKKPSSTKKTTATTVRTTTATTSSVPTGYTLFVNDDISFAYPKEFTKTVDGKSAQLVAPDSTTNIGIDGETPALLFNMKVDEFKAMMNESLENSGMSLSDVKLTEHNKNGLAIKAFSFKTTMVEYGVAVYQTMYIFKLSNYTTYSITVTEYTLDPQLNETILNTLTKVTK